MSSKEANEFKKRILFNAEKDGYDDASYGDTSKFPRMYDAKTDTEIVRIPKNIEEYSKKEDKPNIPQKYTAPKGTTNRAKSNAKKRLKKMRLRVASLILAAGIGVGGISYIGSLNKASETNITQLQEMGLDSQEIGLNDETIDMLVKYDKYFDSFNKDKKVDITDNEIITMVEDINNLISIVIKEKVANLTNVTSDNIRFDEEYVKEEGTHQIIKVDKEKYEKEQIYKSNNSLFLGLGKENSIPNEIANLMTEIDSYNYIIEDLKQDSISKRNAIKKLEKLYNKISEIATKQFSMDKKGNIILNEYEKEIEDDLER